MMMRFTGLAKQSFKMEKARRKVLGFTGAGWWLRRRWGRDSVITMDILVPSVPWGCSSSLWHHHPFSLATFITIFQFSSLYFFFLSFLCFVQIDQGVSPSVLTQQHGNPSEILNWIEIIIKIQCRVITLKAPICGTIAVWKLVSL